MTEFLGNMYSWFTFIPKITLSNLFEILILTVLIYEVLLWVKSTRAGVLLRGGLIIVGFYLLAAALHLNTITWIINHMGQLVLTALIIIFQPELRKALEQIVQRKKRLRPIDVPQLFRHFQHFFLRQRGEQFAQRRPRRVFLRRLVVYIRLCRSFFLVFL